MSMFKRKKNDEKPESEAPEESLSDEQAAEAAAKRVFVLGKLEQAEASAAENSELTLLEKSDLMESLAQHASGYQFEKTSLEKVSTVATRATAFIAVHPEIAELDSLLDELIEERARRGGGFPVLIVLLHGAMLTDFGTWVFERAEKNSFEGIRLVLNADVFEAIPEIVDKFQPLTQPSVIPMPTQPEVADSPIQYFFSISPQIQETVRTIAELAENNIERIYLLGGPGAGKTTLAYYYWLKRNRGRFIAVNLNAESSGDKESMKSLLCGHVTGAYPGASSREGAFSYSDAGVTFLDESHGVTGVVMQVLMEALDSGQYLPLGATKKRSLDCAVIFASNRSWEQLRDEINLDEHARLGAMIVPVHDLIVRKEDLLIGLAIALARFKKKATSWKAPIGMTNDALQMALSCNWSGNMRTLMRVMETALVAYGLAAEDSALLDAWNLQEGMNLWEPTDHHSKKIYTSYR